MAEFRVRIYERGVWDRQEPKRLHAATPLEAAEKACGERLASAGPLGKLRAETWPADRPQEKAAFFSP